MAWNPFQKPAAANPERNRSPSPVEAPRAAPSDEAFPPRRASAPAPSETAVRKPQGLPLDAFGQQGETVRFRISEMSDRLEELKSLQSEFSSIIAPIVAITDELPRAKIRIAEVETLLAQEQASALAMRREVADLSSRLAATTNDLAASGLQLHHLDTSLKDRDAAVDELRLSLRDKTLAAESFERRLFAEIEQTRALQGESKALRVEAKTLDQALARSDSELQDIRESRGLIEQDQQRLQSLAEEQGGKLIEIATRSQEFEAQAEASRNAVRALEQQLATELAGRQKSDAQYEIEIGAHRAERAGMAMRLEATMGRLGTTDQILAQLRNQLRERDEGGRAAERGLKEASIERVTLERRLESVQADLARQTEKFLEMQRARSELDHRCEMFVKAIAAKDAAIEQATGRIASLSDRNEHLLHQREVERADFETVNHRLVEELQHERSERKMSQGALEIARESRVALQKQHDALRRASRAAPIEEAPAQGEAQGQDEPPAPSNVRPFAPADKST